MFSKLIKIISAASMFLILGVSMTATPTVSALGESCSNGTGTIQINPATGQQGCAINGGSGSGSGAGVKADATKVPGANELCGGNCPLTGANSNPIKNQGEVVALLIKVARFLSYISVGVAVLVIIYGGYLYLNPADAKGAETGQKVLVNAAIGLAIAITAVTIVTILSGILTGTYFG